MSVLIWILAEVEFKEVQKVLDAHNVTIWIFAEVEFKEVWRDYDTGKRRIWILAEVEFKDLYDFFLASDGTDLNLSRSGI